MTTLNKKQSDLFQIQFILSCLCVEGVTISAERIEQLCHASENDNKTEEDLLILAISECISQIRSSAGTPVTTEFVHRLNCLLPDSEPISPENLETLSHLIDSLTDIDSPALEDLLEVYVSTVVLKIAGRHSDIIASLILLKLCLDHEIMPILFSVEDMTVYNIGLRSWFWDNRILTDLCKKKQDAINI